MRLSGLKEGAATEAVGVATGEGELSAVVDTDRAAPTLPDAPNAALCGVGSGLIVCIGWPGFGEFIVRMR